jgi:hypothetical protein
LGQIIPEREDTDMLYFKHHQEKLTKRLFVIGVPKPLISPLVREMTKWEIHSGAEWTIKRLKSLKIDLIRMRSNQQPLTWVRKNKRGQWAGPLGSFVRWSLKSDQNFKRGIQAFMAYSFYIFPSLNKTQEEKFLSAINADPSDGLDEGFHASFSGFVHQVMAVRPVNESTRPLVVYPGSPGKKAPRMWGQRSVRQDERILDDVQVFNTTGGMQLYAKYSRIFRPILHGVKERREILDALPNRGLDLKQLQGGEIHFIQEPGGKLRSVASPFRIFQEALRPLGNTLYGIVQQQPWDCTFDSSKAQPYIQSHLAKGGQVHSIDLSSATDLFPLSIQMDALRAVIHRSDWDFVDLFHDLSRSQWKSPLGWLEWKKGQPLGIYPSFATFTLTHGLLLLYLADGHYDHQFFVLGDDVVILNDSLRDRYVSMLDRMRCPWSLDKSLSSYELCEFAGKIITSNWVIPQLKWRQVSDDNFLDLCRLLGRRSRCLLSRRQQRVFDTVAHLCEPVGLNMSLPGDSLTSMVLRTLEAYRPEEEVLASLMDLRGRLHKYVYATDEQLSRDELLEIALTFDEKVQEALTQTVFSRWESSISIGLEALESLPSALDLRPRLPLKSSPPSRKTELWRYERLFAIGKDRNR